MSLKTFDGDPAKMKMITLYLPTSYIYLIDQLVEAKFYPNRAEVIRTAIRDLLKSHNRFSFQIKDSIEETPQK